MEEQGGGKRAHRLFVHAASLKPWFFKVQYSASGHLLYALISDEINADSPYRSPRLRTDDAILLFVMFSSTSRIL